MIEEKGLEFNTDKRIIQVLNKKKFKSHTLL